MRVLTGILSAFLSVAMSAAVAIANTSGGDKPPDYSGISYMYYTLIGLILVYGVYDTFFKKS